MLEATMATTRTATRNSRRRWGHEPQVCLVARLRKWFLPRYPLCIVLVAHQGLMLWAAAANAQGYGGPSIPQTPVQPGTQGTLQTQTQPGTQTQTQPGAQGAYQGPPFAGSFSVLETLTNNVNLSPSDSRQGDLVTQLTPGFTVHERSAHTRLDGSVAIPILLYARTGSENNTVYGEVNLTGTLEAIDKFFF